MYPERRILACFALLLLAGALRAEEQRLKPALDTVTLDDGTIMKGRLTKEEDGKIFFLMQDGETAVIEKSRVRRMESVQAPRLIGPAGEVAVKPGQDETAVRIAPRDNAPKALDMKWARPRMEVINGLGATNAEARQATLARLKDNKDEYLLVMLAMLAPTMKTDEWVRIGILRALLNMGPLNDEAARTLAYDSVHDPFIEARREACRTVRYLQDDRAMRDLMRYATLESNNVLRQAAANSMHEIDDNRSYGALTSAIPHPEVVANYGVGSGLDKPRFSIPSGPGGASVPIFTPSQQISGVASNIGSPVADFLKMVARKDMGNLPYGWLIWYREKIGDLGKDDRDAYREHRSAREKMGVGP